MKRVILKTLHFILDFLFASFIIMFAYIFITVYRGNVPAVFGYHVLRVVSSSMNPLIVEGDCIIVEPVSPNEVRKDDIITFYSDDPAILNYLNTHRVVEVIKNDDGNYEYKTKGDNNIRADMYTAKGEKLLGRYRSDLIAGQVITKGFELLANQKVYFVLIILPILMSFIGSIVSMIKIILDLDIVPTIITGLDDELNNDEQEITITREDLEKKARESESE